MNRKQTIPKSGNIAQLSSPVVNFCVLHTEETFQAHEPNALKKPVLIPPMNEQGAEYFQKWKYCRTQFARG
jgi:hypothetical protein